MQNVGAARSPLRACADRVVHWIGRHVQSLSALEHPAEWRVPATCRSRPLSETSVLRRALCPDTTDWQADTRVSYRKDSPRLGRGMSFADHDVSLLAFSRSNRSWRAGGDTPPARWAHRSQWVSTTRLSWLRQSAFVGLDVRDKP